ncbi:MBL fold metallo-hydrolase [Nonomuraea sp. SBT364]|uniref:MBL fold metallo-hydrolase n=1 Tax=Nonomuraea sp. SBT364 TaxID=1580530 RepID=UPI0009E7E78A|nr:MBL fold metallo-hydrolase [Nonomuraea sp. SBT364]
MKIVEVRPGLHLLFLEFGQSYVWNDGGSLTPVGTGIATAIRELGFTERDVRQVVLTHFHEDHCGGARVVATPGHADGSLAPLLPEHGVLFTGDTVAHVNGQVMPGVFDLDRDTMLDSYRSWATRRPG